MTIIDPEMRLLKALFDQCDLYKNECLDSLALESNQIYLLFLI